MIQVVCTAVAYQVFISTVMVKQTPLERLSTFKTYFVFTLQSATLLRNVKYVEKVSLMYIKDNNNYILITPNQQKVKKDLQQ